MEGPWQSCGLTLARWDQTDQGSTQKVLAQVVEFRIHLVNQRQSFLPPPPLNLFFPNDRVTDIAETLEINQPLHLVLFREPCQKLLLVLQHAPFEIARHARLQHPARTRQNIDVIHHAAQSAIPH